MPNQPRRGFYLPPPDLPPRSPTASNWILVLASHFTIQMSSQKEWSENTPWLMRCTISVVSLGDNSVQSLKWCQKV
eukprot:1138403-Pelagomonas_calceolata.AAC.1